MTKKTTAASSLWSAEWKLPTEEVEQVLLAISFIFKGVKGYVRLQKTKIKDFILNTYIFFKNKSSESGVCRPLLDWQLLTPENKVRLLADKVGRMTNLTGFPSPPPPYYFPALLLWAALHYPNAWNITHNVILSYIGRSWSQVCFLFIDFLWHFVLREFWPWKQFKFQELIHGMILINISHENHSLLFS